MTPLALTTKDRDFLRALKVRVPEDAEIVMDPLEVAMRYAKEVRKWRCQTAMARLLLLLSVAVNMVLALAWLAPKFGPWLDRVGGR